MADLLKADFIDSLPQPLIAHLWGGGRWPVYDISTETGLVRIDVVGMLEIIHIGDIKCIKDDAGVMHEVDDFYVEEG